MRPVYLLPLLLATDSLVADQPSGYYATADGKTGIALQQALHAIVRGHTNIPYSSSSRLDTSDALKTVDADPANTNNVLLVYAERSEPKTNFGVSSGWNREHLWPNSYGLDSVEPAYSDLHNLRPEDANVNSARGNKLYDRSNPADSAYSFPAHDEARGASTDGDSWEPPDTAKGEIARAIFYMAIRYTGDTTDEPRLLITSRLTDITTSTNLMGRLATLLAWHEQHPVTERERTRNDLVFSRFQGNRNPFVDHPEWVRLAFWPALTHWRFGTNIVLSWPIEHQSAWLQASARPDGPWTNVSAARLARGREVSVTLPTGGGAGFYRLLPE